MNTTEITESQTQPETDQRGADWLQRCVRRFVEIMERQHTPTPYEPPKSTYNEAYHGGDCEKHGRWYGICHSCRREQEQHYEDQQAEFDRKQKRDLRDLADEARRLSPNVGDEPHRAENQERNK